jgi:hypothetical protein
MKNLFSDTIQAFSEELAQPPVSDPPHLSADYSYFSSFESCYAFLAEVSLEELQQDAYKLGLDPTGKDKYEIAKMLYTYNQ